MPSVCRRKSKRQDELSRKGPDSIQGAEAMEDSGVGEEIQRAVGDTKAMGIRQLRLSLFLRRPLKAPCCKYPNPLLICMSWEVLGLLFYTFPSASSASSAGSYGVHST
jgi:hypothetical protein